MAEIDKLFSGSLPKFYDTLTVPLIFEGYAADMAARVAALSPRRVLETAAGSGVVTRALAPRLAADARYVVTDLNRDFLTSEAGDKLRSRIPSRRFGELTDLDGPLLLLASDAGAAMSGATVAVDGAHLVSSL